MVLIGILIVIIGFALKFDSIAVIIVSAIATGLAAHMDINEILTVLGKTFVDQRLMTIFILTLPVVGICERYGLKQKAIQLISNVKNLSTGKLLTLYCFIRQLCGAASVRIGGHPQFVRPLINPMAQGAAISKHGKIDKKTEDKIKAASAAAENYGNFYGQNLFLASSGVLLVANSLTELGYNATGIDVAKASIPIAVLAFVFVLIQNMILDKKMDKLYGTKNKSEK